jgi:hypothetical protein
MNFYACSCDEQTVHERLTDVELATLLTRVNALTMLKHLDLWGCKRILGNGLSVLEHSRVIETVGLQQTGADQDPEVALRILRNSIPFKLQKVRLSWHANGIKSPVAIDFERYLQKSARVKALDERLLCEECKEPVVQESLQVISSERGPPPLYCHFCDKPIVADLTAPPT